MGSLSIEDGLQRSQALGFLGPGPIATHITHAQSMMAIMPADAGRFLDLGSGGGIPGLVVALERPELSGVLLDGSIRRTAFLSEMVNALGLEDRISVWAGRAEELGRVEDNRASCDLVIARSFGPPAVVAECAAPFLRVGGHLLVSDPPDEVEQAMRWPESGLATLGLFHVKHREIEPRCSLFVQRTLCPDRFPRRTGIPGKRPLF